MGATWCLMRHTTSLHNGAGIFSSGAVGCCEDLGHALDLACPSDLACTRDDCVVLYGLRT
jgi:hypothetical protein